MMTPSGIEIGFQLDRQWYWMQGQMDRSKRPTLLLVAQALAESGVPYAVIDGVAMQAHLADPRTTLDIDLAVQSRAAIPRDALLARGFTHTGTFEHSDNWAGPDGTPVQFTDDPALKSPVDRCERIEIDGHPLRVLCRADLLREKLRAGADPARRRSKRMQDLADAQALLELEPGLGSTLTPGERGLLDRLP